MNPSRFSESLRRLAQIFGGCRVMIALRNPLTWLPSVYLQELRGNFLKRNRKYMADRAYLDIEEWFDRKLSAWGNDGSFRYAQNIRAAAELLGKSNLGVFVYEDLIADARRYYEKIGTFLGIDTEECQRLTESKHLHPRITQGQLKEMRNTEGSGLRWAAWRFSTQKQRRGHLESSDSTGASEDAPAQVVLPESVVDRIKADTRESHHWFSTEFGLELEKYGYPL